MARLENHEYGAGVGGRADTAGPDGRHEGGDIRFLGNDLGHRPLVLDHRLERSILRAFGESDDLAGVAAWQEILGDQREQVSGEDQRGKKAGQDGARMTHRQSERFFVGTEKRVEEAFEHQENLAVRIRLRVFDVAAAQHRGQGQRDETGNQNGDADGHGEFMQQTADDALHEEHRNEHGDQRNGHRDDREADFLGPLDRRFERRFAGLDVADDVFQHDDGVVDNEADRQGQGKQGKIVQAVSECRHRRESADDGNRQCQAGNHRGRQVAQEKQDDHDDQEGRQDERELHIFDRVTDRMAAVEQDFHVHGGRQLGLEGGQDAFDGIDRFNRVGPRLALDGQYDGAFVDVPAGDFGVFHGVDRAGHVFKAHRGAIAPGDDERAISGG